MIKAVAVEDIIPQDHGTAVIPDKITPDGEGLGQPFRFFLHGIGDVHAEGSPVPEQLPDTGCVSRGADDENITNPRQHQSAEGIVDHGLIIDRQKLLARNKRKGIEPCSGSPGKQNSFHMLCLLSRFYCLINR